MKQPLTEAQAVAKAIAYTENGGSIPSKAHSGKSGELKSIFQFTPETWANDSQQVFGKPGAPLNKDTEAYVATQMVDKWLKAGYVPSQIFSMWNAGRGEPNAYTGKFSNGQSSTGTNKMGVSYNVKSYVDKANKYLSQFASDTQTPENKEAPKISSDQYKNAISTIVGLVKKSQSKPSSPAPSPMGGLVNGVSAPQPQTTA